MTLPSQPTLTGCTIVRNSSLLQYPFRESVLSVLPIVDEMIINCGDSVDNTLEICLELQSQHPKIKILQTSWNTQNQKGGQELKFNTNLCLTKASQDWCLYIQADEVIHEKDYDEILRNIRKYHGIFWVDGLIFNYYHFYGNFNTIIRGRSWYRRELRLFKNFRGIESFRDAQGFRKKNNKRLNGVLTDVYMYHYGYARDEQMVYQKLQMNQSWFSNKETGNINDKFKKNEFLQTHAGIIPFQQTHPRVMEPYIKSHPLSWSPQQWKLNTKELNDLLTLSIEHLTSFRIGEFKNYDLV